MNVCPTCRTRFAEDLAFCGRCGTRLSAAAIDAVGRTMAAGADGGDVAATQVESERRVGTVVGNYRILAVLGEGGMGCVYLAEHVRLGRKVALKMLHPQHAHSPETVRRFFDEARTVNQISHEHIVEITDFIENPGGDNYFIMEHLKGQSLAALLALEPLPLSRALGIAIQVASALGAVHDAGFAHRDLKPDNIFLTERSGQKDFVKLLDFGIVKLLDEGTGGGTLRHRTEAGVVIGTPQYMSPEQASAKPVDFRTDIYSLGVILYELCTRHLPFEADNFGELVMQHLAQTPQPPSKVKGLYQEIPPPLDALILQCLEKSPADRPASMREVELRLRSLAADFSCQFERFDLSPRMSRRSRRRLVWGALAALGVGVSAAFIVNLARPRKAAAPRPAAPVVAPLPPSAPPVPAEITVEFTSTPAGAQVFLDGFEAPLGETPFAHTFVRSKAHETFVFRLPKHQEDKQTVSMDRNCVVAVTLAPIAPVRGKRPHVRGQRAKNQKPGRKTDLRRRGDVLNPFDSE